MKVDFWEKGGGIEGKEKSAKVGEDARRTVRKDSA